MPVKKGHSGALGARAAVAEFAERVWQPDMAVVLFFASPVFARDVLADALLSAFPGITVFGCTTAGEITPEGYREETITGVSFGRDEFAATLTLIPARLESRGRCHESRIAARRDRPQGPPAPAGKNKPGADAPGRTLD